MFVAPRVALATRHAQASPPTKGEPVPAIHSGPLVKSGLITRVARASNNDGLAKTIMRAMPACDGSGANVVSPYGTNGVVDEPAPVVAPRRMAAISPGAGLCDPVLGCLGRVGGPVAEQAPPRFRPRAAATGLAPRMRLAYLVACRSRAGRGASVARACLPTRPDLHSPRPAPAGGRPSGGHRGSLWSAHAGPGNGVDRVARRSNDPAARAADASIRPVGARSHDRFDQASTQTWITGRRTGGRARPPRRLSLSPRRPPTPPPANDGLLIRSPMVGTFYASSSPEAKPFVTPGSTVRSETIVCLIEAMKVFTEINAGVSGTISSSGQERPGGRV